MSGEKDLFDVLSEPLPVVVEALRSYRDTNVLWEHLPDLADSE